MDKGDLERAIADQTEAIRLDPEMGRAYGGRGMAYMKLNDCDRARTDFVNALRIDPDIDIVRKNLAEIYFHTGCLRYALAMCEATTANLMGFFESARDRLKNFGRRSCDVSMEEALAELNEAIRLDPRLRVFIEEIKRDCIEHSRKTLEKINKLRARE